MVVRRSEESVSVVVNTTRAEAIWWLEYGRKLSGSGVTVSTTLAVAVPLPTVRLSKLPPETPVMLAGRLEAALYTSSPLRAEGGRVGEEGGSRGAASPWKERKEEPRAAACGRVGQET